MIRFFAENKVAANLFMMVIVGLGWWYFQDIRRESMPQSELDIIFIQAVYPSASPELLETQMIMPIEQMLENIHGIRRIRSYAQGQKASVAAELYRDSDAEHIQSTIQQQLTRLKNWPESIPKPSVQPVVMQRDLVSYVVLAGDLSREDLQSLAEQVKTELIELEGVSEITLGNRIADQIRIELHDWALQRYQLSFQEILVRLQKQLTAGNSGQLQLSTGSASIMTEQPSLSADQLGHLLVRTTADGGQLTLLDIARITDDFSEQGPQATYNGQPAVYLNVYRQGNEHLLQTAQQVRQHIEALNMRLPEGIQAVVWQDTSKYYQSRIDLLKKNGLLGLLILFIILAWVLNIRLAFWISLGIPIAFLGAFTVLPMFNVSINMISTFGFILVLGIVVDDAIIVGENIHRWQERIPIQHRFSTQARTQAAIRGAKQIAKPVILAVLTSMIMFSPLLFLPGNEGKLIHSIPVVVIAVLLFSLLESFLILPAHLSMWSSHGRFQKWFTRSKKMHLRPQLAMQFKRLLNQCLIWRYTTLIAFLGMLGICLAMLSGQWLSVRTLSPIEADTVIAELHHPIGTAVEQVSQSIQALEESAHQLNTFYTKQLELDQPAFVNIVGLYGQTIRQTAPHLGTILIELPPTENRPLTTAEIVAEWREQMPASLQALDIRFETTLNKPGAPIHIQIKGKDHQDLQQAAAYLKEQLTQYPGVLDIRSNEENGAQDIFVTPLPDSAHLGIDVQDLTQHIEQAFQGIEIAQSQYNGKTIPIRLQLSEDQRSLWDLERLPILLPNGDKVPLHHIAKVDIQKGPTTIKRVDGKRVLSVLADVDPSMTHAAQVMQALQTQVRPEFQAYFPSVTWQKGGLVSHRAESIKTLFNYSILALLLMYVLMAVLFQSYGQPLLVLFAVPFGLVGALMGHAALGLDLTIWSLVGMTAVSGIVVNDNLVLLDYINTQYRASKQLMLSVIQGAMARLRPILLTTATTFAGLVPILLETSIQAQFLIPMAASLAFGVLFATLVTLILVPVMVVIVQDGRLWFSDQWQLLLKPNKKAVYKD